MKVNQDAYITNPHIMGLRHCHFFAVCDGHGTNGREVSSFLKHRLPQTLEANLKEMTAGVNLAQYPDTKIIQKAFLETFAQTNEEVANIGHDVRFSGSTCVSLLTYGRNLYLGNVGDSRAIIVKAAEAQEGGKFAILRKLTQEECTCEQLTRDHKPDDPDEMEVILNAGGRIDSYRDSQGNKVGPERVWLLHEDIPGLAMSRSFGDQVASRVGVNAVPELFFRRLGPGDKIIVMASDGVWEFMENQEVADIVYPFFLQKNAEGAAECLVRAAFKRWKKEENVIDDITCIVIFLDIK